MFLISYQNTMANAQVPTTLCRESIFSGDAIRKQSVMLRDSDSEGNGKSSTKAVDKETLGIEFFDAFYNKITKKNEGERLKN